MAFYSTLRNCDRETPIESRAKNTCCPAKRNTIIVYKYGRVII